MLQEQNRSLIQNWKLVLAYHIRKSFPKTKLFYSAYYFVKFIGIILITHNVANLETNNGFTSKLLYLTIFGATGFNWLYSSYYIIVIIFSVLLLLYLLYFLYIVSQVKRFFSKSHFNLENKLPKSLKYSIYWYTKIFAFLSFFSQHFIVFFTIGLISTFHNDHEIFNMPSVFKYITFCLCILNFIVFISFSYIFWILSSNISLQSQNKNLNIILQSSVNFLVFCCALQGFYTFCYYDLNYFSKEHAEFSNKTTNYQIYINISMCVGLFIHLWISFRYYNFYYHNYALYVKLILVNYCFLSSIVEILLYYCNKSELNSTYSTCLFFL